MTEGVEGSGHATPYRTVPVRDYFLDTADYNTGRGRTRPP
ncbi:hypothetical protein SAMN05421811_11897 [Nonomuraea wenchangensis]|uniref:Uncharacterized protein n=1 Tax=Nonomuraea wenchangensis TaxID=568860 RepID=A0A1I0LKX6_9ACTN|nr:hypothetical protein SAMN05421811_11897 [Nonomuraea wenchangensis]